MREVYIYPHPFANNTYEKIWREIINKDNDKDIEFVLMTNTIIYINAKEIFRRLDEILEKHKGKKIKLIAMGYAPIVSVCTYWAFTNDIDVVFWVKRGDKFVEQRIVIW
jgi:hypothetical protein